MDCAAEEQMVRMKLAGLDDISTLEFDLVKRRLQVVHRGEAAPILAALESLKLDTSLEASEPLDGQDVPAAEQASQRTLLMQVLAINFFFFVLEVVAGFLSNSMGLVADSLDMLADSLVYALALFVVGKSATHKKRVAKVSGYFQLGLAVLGALEVTRRFLGFGEVPVFQTMIIISILALMGNAASLYLLQKSKSGEAHMQASMIFTSNDVVINLGVILAGVLVFVTQSKIPDLVVGAIVFVIVARGAQRILQLAK
jgi:Co/Zn/Cd efflux system component